MGETFYSVLGVSGDADTEAISQAYRETVKECHPDVTDDPAAPKQFKRLTTARDVLVDEHERARYDRLGHDTYVRLHVDSSVWTAEPRSERTRADGDSRGRVEQTRTGGRRRAERTRAHRSDATPNAGGTRVGATGRRRERARTAWHGDTGRRHGRARSSARTTTASEAGSGHASTGVSSTATNRGAWHRASAVYRRTRPERSQRESTIQRVSETLRTAGPWLLVYLVLLASTFATGWFTYGEVSRRLGPTVTLFSLGALGVGVAVSLSIVHFVSQLYA